MLINKIQTPEDMSAFVSLPGQQVDDILKDTPEYLLDILAKVFRALLYKMNLPEGEVDDAVATIKERKMGRLFENVKMDIQAERRNTSEARAELNAARQKLDHMQQERDTAWQKLETTQQERDTYMHILRMLRLHCSDAEILESLTQHFAMTAEQAEETLRRALGD